MNSGRWIFRRGEYTAELGVPDGVPPAAGPALVDFIAAEIGYSSENLAHYRKVWNQITAGAIPQNGMSGNGTSQTLDGDEVVLEALYDQWPTVRISKVQFEAFLDQFGEFLKNSGSRA